ncbi:hypothetical protein ASE12_02680 [Aeromicrobium sp. Root236]|uniref:hypothetical protein n=1 Tax=Aeromicrobium sp. Root236 TaxID=1736498 RepID=UPI0006F2C8F8|nr:hypothetical protein [Aeromicrobium sp. Root236]KRC63766.1 hypothetical protein ASE12_02680 [Aeromicrobium sp. Root236]
MKRVLMAVAGVGLVVAAIGVARAHTGETSTPDAQPSSHGPSARDDISRQVDEQAKQMEKARQEFRKKVEKQAALLRQRQEQQDAAR